MYFVQSLIIVDIFAAFPQTAHFEFEGGSNNLVLLFFDRLLEFGESESMHPFTYSFRFILIKLHRYKQITLVNKRLSLESID